MNTPEPFAIMPTPKLLLCLFATERDRDRLAMTYRTRRPGAGTHRASSQLSRFLRTSSFDTALWQTKNREQLDAAKARLSIADAWRALGLPGEPRRSCRSPFREDRNPSFSIFADGRGWKDFATGEGGDVVSFVTCATACTDAEAIRRVIELAGGISAPFTLAPRKSASKPPAKAFDGLAGVELRKPTLAEVAHVAELRAWPMFAGLEIAVARGLLLCANVPHRGEVFPAWIVTDSARKSAQARRLDGQPWQGEAHTFKSKSLRADAEHPPGLADIVENNRAGVLLCEGEPDALAALLWAWLAGASERVGALALPGASRPLPASVTEKLRGRRVRIVRQNDEAARNAALAWLESLSAAGVSADVQPLDGMRDASGNPAKDLADLIRRPAELEQLEPLARALCAPFLQ
jgi:hypothetical protein